MRRLLLTLFSFLILSPLAGIGQQYTFAPSSTCTVNGGSTLRDWSATSSSVQGEVVFEKAFLKKSPPKAGSEVESAEFIVPVQSLKGRADAMNTKIYNAFKHEEHPNIQFELQSGVVQKGSGVEAGAFVLDCSGILKMAGVEKSVSFSLSGTTTDQGFQFIGDVPIDMTEYGIKPPSAMFGQIVVEPEISVNFELQLEKK